MNLKNFLLVLSVIFLLATCKHEPQEIPAPEIITPNPVDTTGQDTTKTPNFKPCDPDTVYFERDIKDLIVNSCGQQFCHDAATASKGVILIDYNTILSQVIPGNAGESDLFKQIYWPDFDPDKLDELMPQNLNTGLGDSLDLEILETIRKWINQGALNNSCDECDTTDVTFSMDILPILDLSCNQSCHAIGNGQNLPTWDDHATLIPYVDNNEFQERVITRTHSRPMPPSEQLNTCNIDKLQKWIDEGAQNN